MSDPKHTDTVYYAWREYLKSKYNLCNTGLDIIEDYKSRLRELVEARIYELESEENKELSDEEVTFAYAECKKFLEWIDTVTPTK